MQHEPTLIVSNNMADAETTLVEDLTDAVRLEVQRSCGCCTSFVEAFNKHEHTILFSRFDRRSLEKGTLNSICRHIKKAAKIAWYSIPAFDRRKTKRGNV